MTERKYCHTHSKYDCQTCADEILSLGIQSDKDRIAWLESENDALRKDAERYRNALIVAFQHIDQSTHCKDHALVAAAIAGEEK